MATGNLHNNREKLKGELVKIRFKSPLDTRELPEGHPAAIFPIIHYCFLGYSELISAYISDLGFDLTTKNDAGFLESIYKLLRTKFNYVPVLKADQFLSLNYAERKILICLDIIKLVKQKHKELLRFQTRIRRVYSQGGDEEEPRQKTPPRPMIQTPGKKEILHKEEKMTKSNTETNLMEAPYKTINSDPSLMIRTVIELINQLTLRISKLESKVEIFVEETDAKVHLIYGKLKMIEQRQKSVIFI